MEWTKLRQDEFKAAVEESNKVCIIPIGCVESHGIHLPLGCDVFHGRYMCTKAAEIAGVCVFPEIYFGEKSGAGEFPGTIIFPTPLIWQILEQCCSEISRNGFKKILLVSSHGGNTAMLNAFSRYMLQKKPDYIISVYSLALPKVDAVLKNDYPYLTEEDKAIMQKYVDDGGWDGHGGFTESAWINTIYPELTRIDLMDKRNGESSHRLDEVSKHRIYSAFGWMANYPNSYAGAYVPGLNERISKAIMEYSTDVLADQIKFLKEETISNEYHKEWTAKQK
jgi:creatinine amidohydrolase